MRNTISCSDNVFKERTLLHQEFVSPYEECDCKWGPSTVTVDQDDVPITCASRWFAMAISTVFFHFATNGVAISGIVYVPMPAYRRMSHMFQKKRASCLGRPDNNIAVGSYHPSSA